VEEEEEGFSGQCARACQVGLADDASLFLDAIVGVWRSWSVAAYLLSGPQLHRGSHVECATNPPK
jgi:hypothetical protein